MIIKSITHTSKTASIDNLINYVFSDKDITNEQGESITITNLLHGTQSSWAKQFKRVEKRRQSFYGGKEVKFYHEILSFSPDSKPTKDELEDLIYKYLELRLDTPTLAYCGVHFSTTHYHAHVVIQGIDLFGNSIRMSKSSFKKDVQIKMNQYQAKNHPRLLDSIIDYSLPSKSKVKLESHKAWKTKERKGEKSEKEKLYIFIQNAFLKSDSVEAFIANLSLKNISCYYRRNVLTGVLFSGRKYRLKKTLGINFEQLLKPDLKNERLSRLNTIRKKNIENNKNQER